MSRKKELEEFGKMIDQTKKCEAMYLNRLQRPFYQRRRPAMPQVPRI